MQELYPKTLTEYTIAPTDDCVDILRQSVRIIHDLAVETEEITKTYALEAVRTKAMTRVAVADALGKHPLTISRWISAQNLDQSSE